jgi:hypothetical protein
MNQTTMSDVEFSGIGVKMKGMSWRIPHVSAVLESNSTTKLHLLSDIIILRADLMLHISRNMRGTGMGLHIHAI